MKKICPNCQAQYDEKPKFCLKCGTPLVELPEEEAPTVMLDRNEGASPFSEENRGAQVNGLGGADQAGRPPYHGESHAAVGAGPKFCMKCGSPVSGTEKFCMKCGAPLAGAGANGAPGAGGFGGGPTGTSGGGFVPGGPGGAGAAPGAGNGGKKLNNKMIGIIAVAAAAVVVVAVVIAIVVSMAGAYKKPIKNMEKFLNDPSVDGYYALFADNDDILDAMGSDVDSAIEYIEASFDSQAEGDDYKIRLKVTDKEENDTDDVEKLYRQQADLRLDVSKAYELEVKISFKSDERSFEEKTEMYVMKVDGKWMFDALSSGGIL